jgi:transportin-3
VNHVIHDGATIANVFESAIRAKQFDKVKYAVLGIHRASRKARDRRKVVSLD